MVSSVVRDPVVPEISMRPRRRWATNLALAFVSIILGLVVLAGGGEIAARYRERHRTSAPGTMPLLFYRHMRLRHALERNADYFGWVHTNAAGFRGTRPTTIAHDGILRIMVVGGSTTFDGALSDDRTWPARLEYYLQRLVPGRRLEVVNAGVPGYGLVDNLIRLETELYQYQPDVILYYEAHNDLIGALRSAVDHPPPTDTPDAIAPLASWRYWLSRQSLLYTKIAERLAAIRWRGIGDRARPPNPEDWAAAIDRGSGSYARNLTTFIAVARRFGIRIGVAEVTYAHLPGATPQADVDARARWRITVPFASPETVMQAYARFNAVIDSVAMTQKVPLVRTAAFGLDSLDGYESGDPMHFNGTGADRMAAHMAEALLATGLMTGTARPSSEQDQHDRLGDARRGASAQNP